MKFIVNFKRYHDIHKKYQLILENAYKWCFFHKTVILKLVSIIKFIENVWSATGFRKRNAHEKLLPYTNRSILWAGFEESSCRIDQLGLPIGPLQLNSPTNWAYFSKFIGIKASIWQMPAISSSNPSAVWI